MRHTEFLDQINAMSIGRLYLFEGTEEVLKEDALARLRAALLPQGLEAMNEAVLDNPSADAIIMAAETLPFMADRRLVIARECGMMTGKAAGGEQQTAKLKEYLPRIPASCCLVFYQRGEADRRRALPQVIEKLGGRVQFAKLGDAELKQWIADAFAKEHKTCSENTASFMAFHVGRDTTLLFQEIKKAAAYAAQRGTVTDEDIEAICTPSAESRVFTMIDMLADKKSAEALRMASELQKNGEAPLGILFLVLRQFRLMLMAKALRENGTPQGALAQKLGIPSYMVTRLLSQSARYTQARLKAALRLIARTEYLFKSGQYSQQGTLETVLLKLISDDTRIE